VVLTVSSVYCSHDLAMKLQQEEDLSAGVTGPGPVPSQSSLRQPQATASTASNIDKPEKKSDNVSAFCNIFCRVHNADLQYLHMQWLFSG